MLSTKQIEVLQYLINDNIESILNFADECNVSNSDATIGVAKLLVGNSGQIQSLKSKQLYHCKTVIEPLINDVRCDGMVGDLEDGSSSCNGGDYIDEDSLLIAYQTDDMRCQICKYDFDKWNEDNL